MDKKIPERLTVRQREILDFIGRHISEKGYAPTLREIGKAFGFSQKSAQNQRNALILKGWITFDNAKPRSIRLTPIARMFSIRAPLSLMHLGIEKGDFLTVSPTASPVMGDLVLSIEGKLTIFQEGQAIIGKVIGLSRPIQEWPQ